MILIALSLILGVLCLGNLLGCIRNAHTFARLVRLRQAFEAERQRQHLAAVYLIVHELEAVQLQELPSPAAYLRRQQASMN